MLRLFLSCLLCVGWTTGDAVKKANVARQRACLEWMKRTLPESPEWTAWQQAIGALPPEFDQMPKSNRLPDPLRFMDGRPVENTPSGWAARRAEIRQLFERYVTGSFPPKPSILRIVPVDETKGHGYTIYNVRVEFGSPDKPGSVRIRVVLPEGDALTRYPVMISPSLVGWGATVVRRGYISAGYAGNDMMDDAAPLKDLYPEYDFATLPRRAWLAQVVVDYLATLPQVDMARIAINGYSRDGKMALMAAAFDERIAAVVAGSTGVGGAVPWRLAGERGGGEGLETTTRSFPTWFSPQLRFFAGKEDYLPVDANLLLALIAPRAALLQWGYTDQVANGWAMEQAFLSAQTVYERMKRPGKLGLLAVPGFHGSNDVEASIDWLDEQFGRRAKAWKNRFIFPYDFAAWQASSEENINPADYPPHTPAAPLAASASEWDSKTAGLREQVRYMLGDAPVELLPLPSDAFPAFRFNRPAYGPVEIAKGQGANPGQLAPDVPAWVIAAGGTSYGWTAPARDRVASRRIRFGNVTGDFYYPAATPQGTKLPVVIWLHGYHYPLGYMWVYRRDIHPILALTEAGYAVLAYDQSGFGTRWEEAAPFYERFPHYSRMGWMVDDLGKAVDVLQRDSMTDGGRIAVFGYAMGGALGLHAAALDERIAAVVSVCGFTPMRTDTPDKGMSGMTRYSHLYGLTPRLGFFAGKESHLPYDFDDLMGLVAPRPLLVVQPQHDRDAASGEVRQAVGKAREIYTFRRATDQIGLQEPDDYARLTDEMLQSIIDWMKKHF